MADPYVHTGLWINHVKGSVLGATLTMRPRDGTLLVAFLALYVRMAGSQLWSLLCFALHQMRSTRSPQDGLHHQQQVLLRNSTSQNQTLLELLKISWFWRNNAKQAPSRCLPLVFLAVMHSMFFALAGLFSSRVASVSDEVLVRSSYCGTFKFPNVDLSDFNEATFDLANAHEMDRRATSIWSSNYARQCYGEKDSPGCNLFARRQLRSMLDRNAKCPFANEICMNAAESVVRLDSGHIFSDLDLGINTRREDAVVYRTVLTCAPVAAGPFSSEPVNATGDQLSGDSFYYYYFGDLVNATDRISNWTYAYDDYGGRTTTEPYRIDAEHAYLNYPFDGTFVPVAELNTTDSDLVLVFMENYAQYTRAVEDLWFKANHKIRSESGIGDHLYTQHWAVSVLACTEQHQFCNPAVSGEVGCSPLTGERVLGDVPFASLQFSDRQSMIASRIWDIIDAHGLWGHLRDLGSRALIAENYLDSGNTKLSAPLREDQWIQEVTGWHEAILANLQRTIVDYAQGPIDPYRNSEYIDAPRENETWMCANQKVRGTAYYNFSLMGLLIIVIVGGVILLVNQTLCHLVGLVRRWTRRGLSHEQEWRLTHNLQLQRMAYEGARIGSWKGHDKAVPITDLGDAFGLPCDSPSAPIYSPSQPYSPLSPQQPNDLGAEKGFEVQTLRVTNF